MSEAAKQKKKKKKERAQGEGPDAGSDGAGTLRLPVHAIAAPRRGATHRPLALLPAKELKAAGFSAGEPVLVEAASGRCTVANCEVGGREGCLLLTAGVLKSIGAEVGEDVTLTSDFEALPAASLEVEAPKEFQAAFGEVAGFMQLDLYLRAVLEGALVMAGDHRSISFNGRPWQIQVLSCAAEGRAAADAAAAAAAATEERQIWLVQETSRVNVVAPSASDAPAEATAEARGFDNVGGLKAIVEELKEAVQLPLERPDLYRQLGIGPPRGVLLYGPPGTGKTLLARSLGEELRCHVELCAAADLVGTGVGESEDRITAAFDRCRKQAAERGTGALLFIDEIDAVCPKRDDSSEVERRMVAAFLTALDGARGSNDGIVVLGATNRPDSIDPALRRAGRFEREIEVGVPNAEERLQILEVHLRGLKNSLSQADRAELARRCHGYVGADLRALCMSAARAALRKGRDAVGLEHCLEAARVVPPSALKELLVEVPEVRWDDIGGYGATKEALREAVEWPIMHAWAFEAMRVDPPRGVLLYGPPGCSKTMMAKAVATETEMNFVSIKGPELFSKYVGDSERAVRNVFRKARTAAPCVVFFDEIDAIGASREGDGGGGVASRVLAQLLAEMDGIGAVGSRRHVVVLAATNRPHVLDPALTRPGRFDRLVHVPLPDEAARASIFRNQFQRMRTEAGVDVGALAERTEGYSGAEVVMVCREAALVAIRDVLELQRAERDGGCQGDGPSPCVKTAHLDGALAAVQPRIDAQTVQFYIDFEKKTRNM